jgi:hypothetical protein
LNVEDSADVHGSVERVARPGHGAAFFDLELALYEFIKISLSAI